MEKTFKICKKWIIAVLTLCILLGIAGICVNIVAMAVEQTIVTDENTQELMPMMASGCGNLTSWSDIDHATKNAILADVTGNYQAIVGHNPNIYYNSNGLIYLCGVGGYSGSTYITDLQRSWYL